ncbi:DUF4238 domain-containing protein [uncultured Dubosiella sp.]|uniref:DUF4238 domain-containing protein n=1 Tax=uncultured Dubosiella sp. TaxID=1937011 RepID=UPI00262A191E|nr:DUF4238 domain-containing protein [uncultured Dubosiella sp.]
MSNPKRQHFVPRTYLKNFSFQKKKQSRVFVLDKMRRDIFEANIENVAVEKDFYTVNNNDNNYIWEEYYATRIEPMMAVTISNLIKISQSCLIKNNAKILEDDLKIKLSIIMISQLLRGQHCREFEQEILKKEGPKIVEKVKKIVDKLGNEKSKKLVENYEISEDLFKLSAMDYALDEEKMCRLAEVLLNRYWVLYRINGNKEFITSDDPVVFMNNRTNDVTPFHNGLLHEETSTYFPISPKLLIATYTYGTSLPFENNNIAFLDSEKENYRRFVDTINRKQMEHCNKHVFAKTKSVFELLNI